MKFFYIVIAWISLVLGTIGVFLPVVPTVPFLLLSSFCFSRGSKKFHSWFKDTRLYEKYLADFEEKREMTLKNKIRILVIASVMMAISFILVNMLPVRIILAVMALIMYLYFIFRIKTI